MGSLANVVAVIWMLFDCLVKLCPPQSFPKNKKKLLIIRLDAIGDFIIFLDTFKEYKEIYPESHWEITLLGNCKWRELAANLPYADNYIFMDRIKFNRNPAYRFNLLRSIRKEAYDAVVQPTYSREFSFGDSVVRASNATERIGNLGDKSNFLPMQKKISDRWYTKLIATDSSQKKTELELNSAFVRQLGLTNFDAAAPRYPMEQIISDRDISNRVDFNRAYFVVFPGCGWKYKMWPLHKFAESARFTFDKTGWTPVLCGGVEERQIAENVVAYDKDLPWENLVGQIKLLELVGILKNARFLVSNDTCAVHIASAVNCPNICIMGGGHFGRFYPYGDLDRNRIIFKKMDCYGCDWQCKYQQVKCIEEIGVDQFAEEFNKMFKKIYN